MSLKRLLSLAVWHVGVSAMHLQHMVVPVDREGKVGDCSQLRRDMSSSAAATEPHLSSRKAGGRKDNGEPHKVEENHFSL